MGGKRVLGYGLGKRVVGGCAGEVLGKWGGWGMGMGMGC